MNTILLLVVTATIVLIALSTVTAQYDSAPSLDYLLSQLKSQSAAPTVPKYIREDTNTAPASGNNPLLFEKIFIVWFENHGYLQALAHPSWREIISKSSWGTNYHALTHPSQPNYVSLIAGDQLGIKDDKYYSRSDIMLLDLLDSNNISWKFYQEAYQPLPNGECNDSKGINTYARKHNPSMTFEQVRNSTRRCNNIVNSDQLAIDVANNAVPQFSFYTPDMNNDAHDTNMPYAGAYLTKWLDQFLNETNFINNTLLVITFDEDEFIEFNHIPFMLYGNQYVHSGTIFNNNFNHYSLLRGIEDNWGLPSLGRNDATAVSLMQLWNRTATNTAAAVETNSALMLAHNIEQFQKFTPSEQEYILAGDGNSRIPYPLHHSMHNSIVRGGSANVEPISIPESTYLLYTSAMNKLSESTSESAAVVLSTLNLFHFHLFPNRKQIQIASVSAEPLAAADSIEAIERSINELLFSTEPIVKSALTDLIQFQAQLFTLYN